MIVLAFVVSFPVVSAAADDEGCTIIAVGKKASADGSVILSHTDAGPDSRVYVVPAAKHKPGATAPVYWGIQDADRPLRDDGEILGYIPQASETFAYIHSAYPHMNEYQLAIAESTINQRSELAVTRETGEQIMTVEQAEIFALQRCKKARDAVKLIGSLMETYGFLPSSGDGAEDLVIGDPDEAWVLEIFAVGPGWTRESGRPGAIWAAQRIGDDQALVIPNWSIIKEIRVEDRENFHGLAQLPAGSDRPRLVRSCLKKAFHLAGGLCAAAGRIRHQPILAFLQHLHARPGLLAAKEAGQESHGHDQSLSPIR